MRDEPENPPAFPSVCHGDPGHPASIPGMSLRDWFAGQAIAGLLSGLGAQTLSPAAAEITAAEAFLTADAMLEQRAKSA